MPVLWFELPGVFVGAFDIVYANVPKNLLQVNLQKGRKGVCKSTLPFRHLGSFTTYFFKEREKTSNLKT